MGNGVRLKSYIDALNAERNRTSLWRMATLACGGSAMIYGILQATRVLANTFEKRMDTTNEWRGALEDQAKDKATVQQVNGLKDQLEELRQARANEAFKATGSAQLWVIITMVLVLSMQAAALILGVIR